MNLKAWVDKWQLELLLLLIILAIIFVAWVASLNGHSLFQPFGKDNLNATMLFSWRIE